MRPETENSKIAKFDSELRNIRDVVLDWSKLNGRSFVWRQDNYSDYCILVTEIFLQRTRAETVAKFAPMFFHRFSSWRELASASHADLVSILQPIGLANRRATTLRDLAVRMAELRGKIPTERILIEQLPGVGQYIANAIELLVFDKPAPLLDTNMARVIERVLRPRTLADLRHDPFLQRSAHRLTGEGNSKMVNWAVLDFAAMVCKPRSPNCDGCPLVSKCNYAKANKIISVDV